MPKWLVFSPDGGIWVYPKTLEGLISIWWKIKAEKVKKESYHVQWWLRRGYVGGGWRWRCWPVWVDAGSSGGRWRCLSWSGWWPPAGAHRHQSAHRPAAHRQCCKHQSTHRHTDTPTVLLSQREKTAKSIQDRQITKRQYNKFTLYQCFKPHQWNQRHTQCGLLQKKIFNEYQSITQVRPYMIFFVNSLSVLLWISWKMIHQ